MGGKWLCTRGSISIFQKQNNLRGKYVKGKGFPMKKGVWGDLKWKNSKQNTFSEPGDRGTLGGDFIEQIARTFGDKVSPRELNHPRRWVTGS